MIFSVLHGQLFTRDSIMIFTKHDVEIKSLIFMKPKLNPTKIKVKNFLPGKEVFTIFFQIMKFYLLIEGTNMH